MIKLCNTYRELSFALQPLTKQIDGISWKMVSCGVADDTRDLGCSIMIVLDSISDDVFNLGEVKLKNLV